MSRADFDRRRLTEIGHGDAPYWNPVAPGGIDAMLDGLALRAGERALDVGCGAGRMLIELLARSGATGLGVDANPRAIVRARDAAARRLRPGQLELHAGPFDAERLTRASFDALICVGSMHAAGGLERALPSFALLLAPRGRMLIGEGYWKREPDAAYLEWIGAEREEMRSLDATAATLNEAGFDVAAIRATEDHEWDAYEVRYLDRIETHAAAHPADPQAQAMVTHVRRWHEGYRRWGRDTLGFALFLARSRG